MPLSNRMPTRPPATPLADERAQYPRPEIQPLPPDPQIPRPIERPEAPELPTRPHPEPQPGPPPRPEIQPPGALAR